MEFKSLAELLEGYWDRKLEELPKELRERVSVALIPGLWNAATVDQRKNAADQWDYQHDPQYEYKREASFNLYCARTKRRKIMM